MKDLPCPLCRLGTMRIIDASEPAPERPPEALRAEQEFGDQIFVEPDPSHQCDKCGLRALLVDLSPNHECDKNLH